MSIRTEKIESTIQHELAPLLLKYFDVNKFGLITIIKIKVLEDLCEARVYVSVQKNKDTFFNHSQNIFRKITKDLYSRLVLRRNPKLKFISEAEDNKTQKLLDLLDSL